MAYSLLRPCKHMLTEHIARWWVTRSEASDSAAEAPSTRRGVTKMYSVACTQHSLVQSGTCALTFQKHLRTNWPMQRARASFASKASRTETICEAERDQISLLYSKQSKDPAPGKVQQAYFSARMASSMLQHCQQEPNCEALSDQI